MGEPIRVKYRMTIAHHSDFLFAFRRVNKPAGRSLIVYVLIVFLIYAGALCCRQAPGGTGPDWNTIALGVPVIFISLLILIGLFPTRDAVRKQVEKASARSILNDEDCEWTITGQELRVVTRYSDSRYRWDMVIRVIETREFLMMIFADQIARCLPVRGFQSIADLDRFLEIAREG